MIDICRKKRVGRVRTMMWEWSVIIGLNGRRREHWGYAVRLTRFR